MDSNASAIEKYIDLCIPHANGKSYSIFILVLRNTLNNNSFNDFILIFFTLPSTFYSIYFLRVCVPITFLSRAVFLDFIQRNCNCNYASEKNMIIFL